MPPASEDKRGQARAKQQHLECGACVRPRTVVRNTLSGRLVGNTLIIEMVRCLRRRLVGDRATKRCAHTGDKCRQPATSLATRRRLVVVVIRGVSSVVDIGRSRRVLSLVFQRCPIARDLFTVFEHEITFDGNRRLASAGSERKRRHGIRSHVALEDELLAWRVNLRCRRSRRRRRSLLVVTERNVDANSGRVIGGSGRRV